jgi:hypothetical protein
LISPIIIIFFFFPQGVKEIDGPKPYERVKDNDELAATRAVALTIWRFFSNFFPVFFYLPVFFLQEIQSLLASVLDLLCLTL